LSQGERKKKQKKSFFSPSEGGKKTESQFRARRARGSRVSSSQRKLSTTEASAAQRESSGKSASLLPESGEKRRRKKGSDSARREGRRVRNLAASLLISLSCLASSRRPRPSWKRSLRLIISRIRRRSPCPRAHMIGRQRAGAEGDARCPQGMRGGDKEQRTKTMVAIASLSPLYGPLPRHPSLLFVFPHGSAERSSRSMQARGKERERESARDKKQEEKEREAPQTRERPL
jgi:hypothetical protein